MLLSANSGMHGPHNGNARYDMITEAVDFLADAGYDAIDVNFCPTIYDGYMHEPILDGDNWKANLDALIAKCDERKMRTNITHLPYRYDYTNADATDYQKNYNMTCRSLVASEYIGARWAVLHMRSVEGTVAFVKKLLADTQVKKIGLAIENMVDQSFDELIQVHDLLKAEGFPVGICYDFGHCQCNRYKEYDVVETIHLLGDRIKVLHVHDNYKSGDHHREPFAGTIDWISAMRALKEVGFTGELNYEMITSGMPDCARASYARYCVDLGRYLISIYDEHTCHPKFAG